AVAVHQAPEVEHDRVTDLDGSVPGFVVRVGAVGPGSDDGEVDLLVTVFSPPAGRLGRDIGLLPTSEPDPEDLLVGRVGCCACCGQPGELAGVLDRTQHR